MSDVLYFLAGVCCTLAVGFVIWCIYTLDKGWY